MSPFAVFLFVFIFSLHLASETDSLAVLLLGSILGGIFSVILHIEYKKEDTL